MPLRIKKIIGSLAICAIVVLWIIGAVSLSGLVPRHPVAELLYYAVMGLGWALPVMPILSWMEATRAKVRR